jgi:hypothetical protein
MAEFDCLVFPAKGSFEDFLRFRKTVEIEDCPPVFDPDKLGTKNAAKWDNV